MREGDLGREEFRLRVWKSSKAPENIETKEFEIKINIEREIVVKREHTVEELVEFVGVVGHGCVVCHRQTPT